MKKTLSTLLLFICLTAVFAQDSINYNEIRGKTLKFTCGAMDPKSVSATLRNLIGIDTLKISEGRYEYYQDLGMTLIITSIFLNKPEIRQRGISCYNKCIAIDPKRGEAYYDLATLFLTNQEYEQAKKILHFIKNTQKKIPGIKT